MTRKDRGFIYLGRYKYAKQLKNGEYSLYEGAWSDRGEHNTAGLSVRRNRDGVALRFQSLKEVEDYIVDLA